MSNLSEVIGKDSRSFNLEKDEICLFFRPESDTDEAEIVFRSYKEDGQQIGETQKVNRKGEYNVYYINKDSPADGGDFMDNILIHCSGQYRVSILCEGHVY